MQTKKIELKKGYRWEAIADGPVDPVTGKRTQIKRRAKTEREAKQRVMDAIRSLKEDGVNESLANKVTFEMAAEHWLKVYSLTGVKRSTVRIREKEIKILKKHMASVPLPKISHTYYQKIINKIAPDYARTTVQGVNTTANMIFKQAIKDKVIKVNPTLDIVIPKKRKTVEEIESDQIEKKYLEQKEIEAFLNAVIEKGLQNDKEWFYLLAFSGMRSGEVLALKWSDINFKTNEIRISKTIYNEDNNMRKYELTPPKTDGSIRTITTEQEIMDLLKSHKVKQNKYHLKYKKELEDYHDENFVFRRDNGYPFIQKTLISRMKRLLNDHADIEKIATPHIFRHTHISMLTESGVDLPTIMERVGHSDSNTTLQIYTHVTKKMRKGASEKVRTLYENALFKLN